MTGFIYVIECGDAVKIGFANDPFRRLSELNVATPTDMTLIGFIEGTRETEDEIHQRCSSHLIRGEWFRKDGAVLDFISELPPLKMQMNFRLPEDEKAAIERAAYWARTNVTDWMRSVLREASAKKMDEFGERAPFLPPERKP